jgi:hypothetical protein
MRGAWCRETSDERYYNMFVYMAIACSLTPCGSSYSSQQLTCSNEPSRSIHLPPMYAPSCHSLLPEVEEPVHLRGLLRKLSELLEVIPAATCCVVSTSYIIRTETREPVLELFHDVRPPYLSRSGYQTSHYCCNSANPTDKSVSDQPISHICTATMHRNPAYRFSNRPVPRCYAGIVSGIRLLSLLLRPPASRPGQISDCYICRPWDMGRGAWTGNRS